MKNMELLWVVYKDALRTAEDRTRRNRWSLEMSTLVAGVYDKILDTQDKLHFLVSWESAFYDYSACGPLDDPEALRARLERCNNTTVMALIALAADNGVNVFCSEDMYAWIQDRFGERMLQDFKARLSARSW
jgi:hypothetical protein